MKKRSLIAMAWLFAIAAVAQIPQGYYDPANGLTGEQLKATLNNIIDGHVEFPYTSSNTDVWDALKVLDADPANSNNVICIYSRFSIPAAPEYANADGWNREHVWAKSRGDFGESLGPGTDLHHLRAADISTNSARSNRPFDNGGSTYVDQSGTYSGTTPAKSGNGTWEPGDGQKGDVARMIFYMATRYEGENGEPDLELTEEILGTTDKQPLHGKLSTLLIWHAQDPVDESERTRNNKIYYDFQRNRNPFIDHPEWVDDIWGSGNSGNDPVIIVSQDSFSFGEVSAGESSEPQIYTVSGTDLEEDISVSVSAPFELSLDNNSSYSQSLFIPEATAESTGATIYVRFSPDVANGESFTGSISHTSAGAETQHTSVTGVEYTLSVSDILTVREGMDGQQFMIRGVVSTPEYGTTNGQFFVQDATGGIKIFNAGNTGIVSYGNEVEITGVRGTYNSVIQLEPTDIQLVNASGVVPDYEAIDAASLSITSSKLGTRVKIAGVSLSNPAEWPANASGTGANVSAQVGSTNFVIRIDDSSFYYGTSVPSGELVISGVLSRFYEDVQILPFFEGDVIESAVRLPVLTVSTATLEFPQTIINETSATQTVTIQGQNLEASVTVGVCCQFEISNSADGTFGEMLELLAPDGSINETVFVRFAPITEGSKSASISVNSSGEAESIQLIGEALPQPGPLPTARINEVHYNNVAADRDEFVEVYVQNPQHYSLADFQVQLINGVDGQVYGSFNLTTATEGTAGYYYRNFGGIQNGPDAIKLTYQGDVLQFISYGGAVADAEVLSVEETDETPTGNSLQLCCDGEAFEEMSWVVSIASPGLPNEAVPLGTHSEKLLIYPNPTRGAIHLEGFPDGDISVRLFTLQGVGLFSATDRKDSVETQLGKFLRGVAAGFYVLELGSDSQWDRITLQVRN